MSKRAGASEGRTEPTETDPRRGQDSVRKDGEKEKAAPVQVFGKRKKVARRALKELEQAALRLQR